MSSVFSVDPKKAEEDRKKREKEYRDLRLKKKQKRKDEARLAKKRKEQAAFQAEIEKDYDKFSQPGCGGKAEPEPEPDVFIRRMSGVVSRAQGGPNQGSKQKPNQQGGPVLCRGGGVNLSKTTYSNQTANNNINFHDAGKVNPLENNYKGQKFGGPKLKR